MYLPTRSASGFVLVRTRLWTLKPAPELEEDPQHLGNGEDDLAMRYAREKRLPHLLALLLDPIGTSGTFTKVLSF